MRSRAAVGYYGAALTDADRDAIFKPVRTPTLAIYGEDEPPTRRAAFGLALPHLGLGSRVQALPGVGHWQHAEAPVRVGNLVAGWFQ